MQQHFRKYSINGLNFRVFVGGRGKPVLLLHGFPDSLLLWRHVVGPLIESGYQVIAPDQRGFGETDAPDAVQSYRTETIVSDSVELLRQLEVEEPVRLVGHDWGAFISWQLAIEHRQLIHSLTAISVGHPLAYRNAGWEQKRKGWYVLAFQFRGFAERMFRADNWGALRRSSKNHPELEHWIADLSRQGRLEAGLSWYRANFRRLLWGSFERCAVPVMGIYSPGDVALTEEQMLNSSRYIDGRFRYERIENSSHWIPLDQPGELSRLLLDWFKE